MAAPGVPADHSWAAGSSVPVPGLAHFGPPGTPAAVPLALLLPPAAKLPLLPPCPGARSSWGGGELGATGQGQARAEHGSSGPQGATNGGSWANEPVLDVWPH